VCKEEITFDVVVELSEDDLIRLGIAEFGKRKKLLVAIEQLPNFRPHGRKGTVVRPLSDSIEEGSDGDSNNHHDRENFLRINPESDEEELMIQVEDHYADLGDGIILETEEKSSSAYRKSSEFAGDADERVDLLDETQESPSYRLIHAKELRIQRHPIGRGVFGIVYSAGTASR